MITVINLNCQIPSVYGQLNSGEKKLEILVLNKQKYFLKISGSILLNYLDTCIFMIENN